MKTKLFTLLLAVAASIGTIFADKVQIGDLYYNLNDENKTAEVTSGGNYSGSIVIPSSVTYNSQTYSVTSIGIFAFDGCSSLTSVAIPNSVTSIGWEAFSGCSGLTSVTIPNSVTSIGASAFYDCSSLTSINIPNSVTSIGDYAFYGCSSLTSIGIPNSVTSIGNSAFYGCSGLTSPVYNAHVFAFMPTSYSGAYTIPDGIESIAGGAFGNCEDLTSIEIPNSVTSIGDYAFSGCTGLTSVVIPDSVENIGGAAFSGCTGLTSPVYNAHVFAYMPTSYFGGYAIPDGIESIAGYAFLNCTNLTSVTIPNSITSIGEGAFRECTSLTSVTIGSSVTSIGARAFSHCSSLTSVEIPYGVTSIGGSAFKNCRSLTDVICLPTPPPPYEKDIFDDCTSLKTIYVINAELYRTGWSGYYSIIQELSMPYELARYNYTNGYASTSVISREGEVQMAAVPDPGYRFVKWADGNTENPRTIDYSQRTIEPVFEIVLSDKCGKDNVLTWTLDTTTMALNITGKGALSENYTYGRFIESLTIGNEITQIGVEAFAGREKLKDVIIGSSVKVLEKEAFRGCSAIETITCYSQRPPTVSEDALYGVNYSTIVYVPAACFESYKMHDIWGLYDVQSMGYKLTLAVNNPDYGTVEGAGTYAENAEANISAKPYYGYHFVRWSDGNADNPRTIIITKDTELTAEFAIDKNGVCGKDNALKWIYEDKTKTLTISGRGELTENYTYGVEAPTQMKVLVIGNDVTAIGERAFYAMNTISHLTIGGSVTTIGNLAFAECNRFDDITCYSEVEPAINATTFDNVGNKQYIYLFVPESRVRAYKRDTYWGEFDVQAIGAEQTETNDVKVESTETTAAVTWPAVESAYTYELVIKDKSGNVICTLVFNAQGQLTQIVFGAPAHGKAPQQTQSAGFSFVVTGLDEGTSYDLTITAKDENDNELDKKNVSFHTEGTQGIEDIHFDAPQATKILLDGQVYILRGEHVYDTAGKMVR